MDSRKPQPIALIDMDGTIADFDKAMLREMKKIASPSEDPKFWGRDGDRLLHMRARREMVMKMPGFYRNLEPIESGMRLYRFIVKTGFQPHILSKGPNYAPNAWTEKLEWCQQHLPEKTPVNICQFKEMVYGRVLVDDWIPYVQKWLAARPRGTVILPSRPWNKGFRHARAVRYTNSKASWREVTERLDGIYRLIVSDTAGVWD